jgi:hypothetical protein
MQTNVPSAITPQPLKDVTGNATTDVFTSTGHGLVADDAVAFSSKTGGTGLVEGTRYYVISAGLTTDNFQISATQGGSAFTTMSTDLTAGKVQKINTWKNVNHLFNKEDRAWIIKYLYNTNGTLPTDATTFDDGVLLDFYMNRRIPA